MKTQRQESLLRVITLTELVISMKYMKTWIVVKIIWNFSLIGLSIILLIIGLDKLELSQVFYLIGIIFFVWFMVNEILEPFKPIPVLIPPHKIRRKNNDITEN